MEKGRNEASGAAWNRLYSRLDEDGLLEGLPSEGKGGRMTWRAMAAAVLLVLAVGLPALYFGFLREQAPGLEFVVAETGVRTVDLPDGSRVVLNRNASISYPAEFAHDRHLELEGEAFFEVMADPQHPFTVHTGRVLVSVLGTSFNVRSRDQGEEVEVLVESGLVRVDQERTARSLLLEPGEYARSDRNKLNRVELSDLNYMAWKTKEFRFVDEELEMVLAALESSYHIEISADSGILNDLRITTSYSGQTIESILETVSAAFGLSLEQVDHGYHLRNQTP